jgi:hypothetical protein
MSFRTIGVRLAAFTILGWSQATSAQSDLEQFTPPVQQTDARGVDLVAGRARISIPLASFGQSATTLAASIDVTIPASDYVPQSTNFVQTVGGMIGLHLQPKAQETGNYYADELGTFVSVVFPNAAGAYLAHPVHDHTNPDGSKYTTSIGPTHMMRFTSTSDPSLNGVYDSAGDRGQVGPPILGLPVFPITYHIDQIDYANGERWTFYRDRVSVSQTGGGTAMIARLRSVVSSRGYAIQFLYMTDVSPTAQTNMGTWLAPRRVTAYNKASVYCNEALLLECPAVTTLPSADIVYDGVAGTVTIRRAGATDGIELTYSKIGSNWTETIASMRHTAVPGSAVTYQVASGAAYLQRLTNADGTWNYTHFVEPDDSGYVPAMQATSTNPLGGVVQVLGHTLFGQNDDFDRRSPRISLGGRFISSRKLPGLRLDEPPARFRGALPRRPQQCHSGNTLSGPWLAPNPDHLLSRDLSARLHEPPHLQPADHDDGCQ